MHSDSLPRGADGRVPAVAQRGGGGGGQREKRLNGRFGESQELYNRR